MMKQLQSGLPLTLTIAIILIFCCIAPAGADETNESNVTATIPMPTNTVVTQVTTLVGTIVPTITESITPVSTQVVENSTTESSTPEYVRSMVVVPTQEETVTSTNPVTRKSLGPSVQRKISTNLLYMIDSGVPETGMSRESVQSRMVSEGKFRTVKQLDTPAKSGRSVTAVSAEPPVSLVLVYIDLMPSASTTVVDSYVTSITERNEQDHSVVAWVDVNKLDALASLDAVSNVRTAEPSVTKTSPVYHDTKFVNKRAGMPMATAEDARASVREFEKTPGMQLEQKRTMSTPRGEIYEMASDNGRYFVNAKTGAVELASYYPLSTKPDLLSFSSKTARVSTSMQSDPVTMEQAYTIAQNYAGKNYRNFNNRIMVLTESTLIDHGAGGKTYYFTWMEKINAVTVPNGIVITVNADTGQVMSYVALDQSISADIDPSILKSNAINTAISAFSPMKQPFDSKADLAVIIPDGKTQTLVWSVDITGSPQNADVHGGRVFIDAHSGEILKVNSFV